MQEDRVCRRRRELGVSSAYPLLNSLTACSISLPLRRRPAREWGRIVSASAYTKYRDRRTIELLRHRCGLTPMDPQTPPSVTASPDNLSSTAKGNLELLTKFKDGEEAQISGVQLLIERISGFFGSPAYFAFAVAFIVIWMLVNAWGTHAGWRHVDAPPFPWLQGLVSSNALLLTVAVLIRQKRMEKIAEHRSHFDLQI